jgi:peptidoglycan-associated lipoprotein
MFKLSGFAVVLMVALVAGACAKKPVSDSLAVASASAPAQVAPAQDAAVSDTPAVANGTEASLTGSDGTQLTPVYFAFDSAELSAEARQALVKDAAWLTANPQVKITVEGHCDERGSDEYNLALGEQRAQAVQAYLTTLGVGMDRIATISYGEEFPAVPGHDEAAWAMNRRAMLK